MAEHRPGHGGHEKTDVNVKPIVVMTVLIAAACLIALLAMIPMFDYLERREAAADRPPSPLAEPNPLPPEPRLQVRPGNDLDEYRERSIRQLEKYQWIDPDARVVRIPIDRAIDLILERGLEPREGVPQAAGQSGLEGRN